MIIYFENLGLILFCQNDLITWLINFIADDVKAHLLNCIRIYTCRTPAVTKPLTKHFRLNGMLINNLNVRSFRFTIGISEGNEQDAFGF